MKFNLKLLTKAKKAFTLIELMLVLGLTTAIFIAAVQADKRAAEYKVADAAATQMQELGAALSKQISINTPAYLSSGRITVTIADLQANGLLPAFYTNRTPFGGTIDMEVVSTGGANPNLVGLVTTTAWVDADGDPRYDLLGAAIKKIGAQGGASFYSTTTIAGLNGGWSAVAGANPGEFSFIGAAGQLSIRAYSDVLGYDNVYLRRDGTLPMTGNFDVGFHDINNAVNISANGWVYANHIAANDATVGSLFSNYIRNTGGIDTAQITGIGSSSTANFEYMVARTDLGTPSINSAAGTPASLDVGVVSSASVTDQITQTPGRGVVNAQDIYIRDARGSGTWLSDRLPKFSSRGVYFVTDGDEILKPSGAVNSNSVAPAAIVADASNNYSCNYAAARNGIYPASQATVKVELIPQSFFTQGRTDGTIDFTGTSLFNDPGTNVVYGSIVATPDLNTLTNFRAFATEMDDRWVVNLNNWGYYNNTYPFNSGWALAHVYCDYS